VFVEAVSKSAVPSVSDGLLLAMGLDPLLFRKPPAPGERGCVSAPSSLGADANGLASVRSTSENLSAPRRKNALFG
jgi:hypothetical protein